MSESSGPVLPAGASSVSIQVYAAVVVADYNPDAKRFYERNGYQQVGKIPNLYRSGITEYMMAKDLRRK